MPVAVDIGSLIGRSPEIRGGRPRIASKGVTVMRIAGWHTMGFSPEEIVGKFGHLTLAQVHAALAYYCANRTEIDEDPDQEEAAFDLLRAQTSSNFSCRPNGRAERRRSPLRR
jgi:uncharacterized protein (DUF433 family)